MRLGFDRRLALGFALGVATALGIVAALPKAEAGKRLERKSFHSAIDMVLERYVEPVDAGEVMARGLKHMVGGLDGYSHYLTADERKVAQKKLKSGAGIGVSIGLEKRDDKKLLEILAVEPGSPADRVGLGPGDYVHEVRGRDVSTFMSQAEAELSLVGSEGEAIELVVQRRKDPGPKTFGLILAKQRHGPSGTVDGALVERHGKKLAHLRIRAFRSGTGDQVKRRLKELRRSAGEDGLSGIVLDVRGNPGGEVSEAVIVADLFVQKGVLTRTRGRGGRILREEKAHEVGTDVDTPLVVLQDRHSASAAELLAVALQDHSRAQVVGERSYGKGTVQDVIGMEDGSVLTLTVARYFSPQDRMIDAQGVQPDVHRSLKGVPEPAVIELAASAL
jgi:carboxyl-terminal processing protease